MNDDRRGRQRARMSHRDGPRADKQGRASSSAAFDNRGGMRARWSRWPGANKLREGRRSRQEEETRVPYRRLRLEVEVRVTVQIAAFWCGRGRSGWGGDVEEEEGR